MYSIIQYKFYNSISNFSGSMLEDASKKSEWCWNSCNSKHGDEIGVGGHKLKWSNIGIELHVESPLPPEWQQFLDLQVCFLLCFS